MKLSHSKLTTILSCPMTYYLNYKQGISLKSEKPALAIGSAVHWGIEHDTDDLTEYYKENGTFKQQNNYGHDELLAESMVYAYKKYKDEIFKEILKDLDTGKQLELIDEQHELNIEAKLPSHRFKEPHNFVGIIDLLLLTEKGFIIIDYKTSSQTPDWNKYLDQIYRYIFLLHCEFPDVPVYKIGIVNLKKSMIRMKNGENEESFLMRLKKEYDINEDLVNTHIYLADELNPKLIEEYIDNLSDMADTAQMIDDNEAWFINYANANGQYGKSQYWDIFYNTPDCYLLYKIKDTIFDPDDNTILDSRDCLPIDMLTLHNKNVMNHFTDFESCMHDLVLTDNVDPEKEKIYPRIKEKYITDDSLLDRYWTTWMHEIYDDKNIFEKN